MTNKTYTCAGTSTFNGKTKVRFANDFVNRFKILTKNGHENIELIELDQALSKEAICKMLISHDKFQSEDQQSAISEYVVRNVKTADVSTPDATSVTAKVEAAKSTADTVEA
jgi:hypothetical protein